MKWPQPAPTTAAGAWLADIDEKANRPAQIAERYPMMNEKGKPGGFEGQLTYSWSFLQAVLLREPQFRERLYRPLLDRR